MLQYMVQGGIAMIPLVICSIALVAVLLERRNSLEPLRLDLKPFKQRLVELLRGRDIDGAIRYCESSASPIAEILAVGLRRYRHLKSLGRSDEGIEGGVVKAMEDHASGVVNGLEKYLGALFVIGNVAPLLGFLGTVTGMIKCFKAIARTGGMRQDAIASGISEALIACATGLFIAIPAFVAYNYFTARIKDFVVDADVTSAKIVETVMEEGD